MKHPFNIMSLVVCSLPAWSQSAPATNLSSKKTPPVQPKSVAATQVTSHNVPLDTAKTKIMVGHQNINIPADRNNAQLLDVTGQVVTGGVSEQGKDADTHWSFGLFDHNDKPIASFHDDSNNDKYDFDDRKTVKMHLDNPAQLKDFIPIGRIHVNIAPNGNDTWAFDELNLTFDFINPGFTLQVSVYPGIMSQDHRDTDLIFAFDGQNFKSR